MSNKNNAQGFIYIDVLIAIVILMVGIMALAAAMTAAVVRAASGQQQMRAKQYAEATMETIISARDIKLFDTFGGWDAIGNQGSNCTPPGSTSNCKGIFVNGWQPVRTQISTNGLYDPAAPIAGLDGVIGTGDDAGTLVPGFQRQIIITDICDPDRPSYNCPTPGTNPVKVRQITVNVSYMVRGLQFQESLSTILANY